MDLMKRLVEFRENEFGDITNIDFEDEGDWCHLYYNIISKKKFKYLSEIYEYGLTVIEWIENIVDKTQRKIGEVFTQTAQEYSKVKLLDIPDLLNVVETEINSNKKGRALEELISKLFIQISGFEIKERVKTETEEIDILILNKSNESIWIKESVIMLAECKNWSSVCGKNEFVIFKEKLKNRRGRVKIGFFISWNGFAKTFNLEELRSSHEDTLIILITGKDIKEAIQTNTFQELLEEKWLKAINQ